ncbi:phage shock envelope stress response protein PspM [Kutzneria kofuensis]|uniref:Uncharacterized protein n=1 Tax=Kutzneria kofuensis TaxID=103725 RepID=A0A7W9KKK3_9PSEU|nr:hypothetical protein [Kutzneria kofuensis]MBB5894266.1 hypothetical protein [Kutzneria kofuensis]
MVAGPRRRDLGELIRLGQSVGEQLRGPVADTVRTKVHGWRDPRAKLLRRRRRAKRSTAAWSGATALGGVWVGIDAAHAELFSTVGGFTSMIVTALFLYCTSGSVRKLVTLQRQPLPPAVPPPVRLPPAGSAAREPMRRLAEAEASLAELLVQLGTPRPGGLAPLPAESLAHAQESATEAATALRAVAAQLAAVERARTIAPASQRGPLDQGITDLRRRLDEGLDGYLALIGTAGQAVIASSPVSPNEALLDASDRLSGLASALRELSGPDDYR